MDEFQRMHATFNSPQIQGYLTALGVIAGYQLSPADRQPFLYFHGYITAPQPDFISSWRGDPKSEIWYHRLTNGMLGDVQNSLACVHYHCEQLTHLEQNAMAAFEKFECRSVLGNSTIAPGNTLKLDFEYQAFVLACRRTLDHMSISMAAYFKDRSNSFRKIDKTLHRFKSKQASDMLLAIYNEHRAHFNFVATDGYGLSIRDRIAHYEFVPAGVVNLSVRGFVIAGGAENLAPFQGKLLSEVVQSHANNLRRFVRIFLPAFVDAMRLDQAHLNHEDRTST